MTLTPGARRRIATIQYEEPCEHGSDDPHDACPGGIHIEIPGDTPPADIRETLAKAIAEATGGTTIDHHNAPSHLAPAHREAGKADEHETKEKESMTLDTATTNLKDNWPHYIAIALHALIIWPFQYLIWAPIVTLASWTWILIKGAAKIGLGAILLLLIPVIGWIILGIWIIMRSNNKNAERRHAETMAAMGHPLEETQAGIPIWKSVWTPWKMGI